MVSAAPCDLRLRIRVTCGLQHSSFLEQTFGDVGGRCLYRTAVCVPSSALSNIRTQVIFVLQDKLGRQIKDLRVSVTDRCNFKCFYCKSAKGFDYVEHGRILTYEEIERLVRLFVRLGISKVRITGGEPMLRRNIEGLIARIAGISGLHDLALTTNGFNFCEKAAALQQAGLHRVTLSLDSLRRERFEQITRSKAFDSVLRSLEVAVRSGFTPVKVNCVLVRGVNDDEILDFAELAQRLDVTVRFIEFMPIDEDENWSRERVVSGTEILETLRRSYQMRPLGQSDPSQTARNYEFVGGCGRIGLIMPVSNPFCGACSRIRLTADGKLRTCLFSLVEHDIKGMVREGADDRSLEEFIRSVVLRKEPGHRINQADFRPPPRTMSYIGG